MREFPRRIPTITEYAQFFERLTDFAPYPYQERLAVEPWPELLDVPTGLGKTAALGVAWIWKRHRGDQDTPRRLVYCLPMRSLVEQTHRSFSEWLMRAEHLFEGGTPRTQLLMGGAAEDLWAREPEREAVIIGTQDMLLSRGLNRGYGMSPFQWPIHFGLLHTDALWVFDEVQLMGPGIGTSAQLEGLRRALQPAGPTSRSLWCSATISSSWLATVDHPEPSAILTLDEVDREQARQRLESVKLLERASSELDAGSSKRRFAGYLDSLAIEVLSSHVDGTRTLVIVNRVDRAQELFRRLRKLATDLDLLLLHSRFRPPDRERLEARLVKPAPPAGQIVVTTQVVEAGVDVSSRTLFTELCPWSSFVQRCGRCNRYGEWNDKGGSRVIWIDIDSEDESLALPYGGDDLDRCRTRLKTLPSVSPTDIPPSHDPAPVTPIVRRRDLLDLFSTDADLSGFHVDVSPYIRDSDERTVQVFWRDLGGSPPAPEESYPSREELCSTSLSDLGEAMKRSRDVWRWDPQAARPGGGPVGTGRWVRVRQADLFPGLVVMMDAASGAYDPELGFEPTVKSHVELVVAKVPAGSPESHGSDELSRVAWVSLRDHLEHVRAEVGGIADALGLEDEDRAILSAAALWHDVGKLHPVFQEDLLRGLDEDDVRRTEPWAKSATGYRRDAKERPTAERLRRRYFRHELASALVVLERAGENIDLIAYLVAAHHGKVRTSLRAWPEEPSPDGEEIRYARGIWEGDRLPAFDGPGDIRFPETRLSLDLMELGDSGVGASWTERVERLLETHGPFRLAWLEAILRMADWRASAQEALGAPEAKEP